MVDFRTFEFIIVFIVVFISFIYVAYRFFYSKKKNMCNCENCKTKNFCVKDKAKLNE